jgi:hypothetical protein
VPLSRAGLPRRRQETSAWSCLVVECGDDDRDNQQRQFLIYRISPDLCYETTDQKARPAGQPGATGPAGTGDGGSSSGRPASATATSKDVGLLVQRHEAAAGYRRGITRCHEEHVPRWTGPWAGCRGTPSTASVFCALVGIASAAHAPAGPGRTYGKEKVYGSIP